MILLYWIFGQNGAGHAKPMVRYLNEVSEQYPEVVFGKINTEEEPELGRLFNIRSIPTTIAFKEQIGVFMQPGALPEQALMDLVKMLQELDMDEVRTEMEARKSED